MRRAVAAAVPAARRLAAPGSLRWLSAEAGEGSAGDAPLPPAGRGRGAPLDAAPGAGPGASRGRGRAEGSGLLRRVLGEPPAGATDRPRVSRARSAPPAGAAEPPPPRPPREGPPREFTSRRVAAAPAHQGGPGRPAASRDGWAAGRARSPPARGGDAEASSGGGDAALAAGAGGPERRRSRWSTEAAEFSSAVSRARAAGRSQSVQPSARRGAPRTASPATRAAMAAAAAARAAAPDETHHSALMEFVDYAFDPSLDTSDVGVAPVLWDTEPEMTPEALLAVAGGTARQLSGVTDDAEWAAICSAAVAEWGDVAAAQRSALLRAGGSGLHAAGEDAALAATAARAEGSAGAAFAARAAAVLARNPRWHYAAKQRALSMAVSRATH